MSEGILLSQYSGAILGPIAKVLGLILNAVFNVVPNVGIAIILFTVIIYLCLLPLTYKQQKFSKLSAKMNPEIQKVQAKYKGKQDQASMQRQNEEVQAIYRKYGVSPTGSCLQLLIQMPILFALYRVINSIPAYVTKIYEVLEGLSKNILSTEDGINVISNLETTQKVFAKYVSNNNFTGEHAVESVMDILNRATSKEWDLIGQIQGLDVDVFNNARNGFESFNTFFGLNISNTPMYIIKDSFESGNFLLVIGAVLIPVLAALTQWINIFFMPQPSNSNSTDQTASMMKSMNLMMPLMSAFFCLSLPCGMGIYWISGAVIRSIEQIIINKRIDKMDIDSIIEKNIEKYNEKIKGKEGSSGKISANTSFDSNKSGSSSAADKDAAMAKAEEYYKNHSKPGSISAKANMVKQFNERNKK
ncbi:MAG: YidC/Oxa1 family membrane protein insertase [Lachnospiraceae bacterium]|nr:YidC/Oxa1 family membrane protein insertase [Lachnospiraceae bacterium]